MFFFFKKLNSVFGGRFVSISNLILLGLVLSLKIKIKNPSEKDRQGQFLVGSEKVVPPQSACSPRDQSMQWRKRTLPLVPRVPCGFTGVDGGYVVLFSSGVSIHLPETIH